MCILDRYVLRFFLLAYLVCFVSLLSLYMVIDLFSRIDEFAEHSHGTADLFANIGTYYLFRIPWFFQRLSGVICLMAAMFALAWLERNNEVTAWLAAGIPARRLVYPILAATLGMIGLGILNRELLIPRCSVQLQRTAEDVRGRKALLVQPSYDAVGIHIEGRCAVPERKMISLGNVLIPADLAGELVHLSAREMYYRPARGDQTSGWWLYGTTPEHASCPHPALNWLGPGSYFLHTEASFRRLTRKPDWFYYEPTTSLMHLAGSDALCQRRDEVVSLLHRRLTAPLLEMILVLLGIPIMFGRFDRNLFLKVGVCMVIYAVFQATTVVCNNLGQREMFDPALAAWLPVFVFGPLALVMADGMKT